MADIADIAESNIPEANTAEISARFLLPSNEYCDECGDDIPQLRRSLGGVTHCVYCQDFLEKKSKMYK